ncbi:glycerophosphodiester phosphodiesterase [Ureibacillus sp. NPDC094379]
MVKIHSGKLYYGVGAVIVLLIGAILFLGSREIEAEPAIVTSPKIFAHRGANDRFNESTLSSYEIAANDQVDALELDLRMTKDGVLIVMHDETIDRTTNGSGKVNDLTIEEIKSFLTVGEFNKKVLKEEIPTLEEVLKRFGSTQNYYIETRLVNGETIMERPMIELLNTYQLIVNNKVLIQSFSEESLEKVSNLAPQVPLTLLFKKGKFDLEKALTVPYQAVGIESSDVTINIVNELHKAGKEIHVFFNNPKTMFNEQKRMKELNIDGYFTNNITYTKELLNK